MLELTGSGSRSHCRSWLRSGLWCSPAQAGYSSRLENPIATKLLENTFTEGDTILVDYADGQLHFNHKLDLPTLQLQGDEGAASQAAAKAP